MRARHAFYGGPEEEHASEKDSLFLLLLPPHPLALLDSHEIAEVVGEKVKKDADIYAREALRNPSLGNAVAGGLTFFVGGPSSTSFSDVTFIACTA